MADENHGRPAPAENPLCSGEPEDVISSVRDVLGYIMELEARTDHNAMDNERANRHESARGYIYMGLVGALDYAKEQLDQRKRRPRTPTLAAAS